MSPAVLFIFYEKGVFIRVLRAIEAVSWCVYCHILWTLSLALLATTALCSCTPSLAWDWFPDLVWHCWTLLFSYDLRVYQVDGWRLCTCHVNIRTHVALFSRCIFTLGAVLLRRKRLPCVHAFIGWFCSSVHSGFTRFWLPFSPSPARQYRYFIPLGSSLSMLRICIFVKFPAFISYAFVTFHCCSRHSHMFFTPLSYRLAQYILFCPPFPAYMFLCSLPFCVHSPLTFTFRLSHLYAYLYRHLRYSLPRTYILWKHLLVNCVPATYISADYFVVVYYFILQTVHRLQALPTLPFLLLKTVLFLLSSIPPAFVITWKEGSVIYFDTSCIRLLQKVPYLFHHYYLQKTIKANFILLPVIYIYYLPFVVTPVRKIHTNSFFLPSYNSSGLYFYLYSVIHLPYSVVLYTIHHVWCPFLPFLFTMVPLIILCICSVIWTDSRRIFLCLHAYLSSFLVISVLFIPHFEKKDVHYSGHVNDPVPAVLVLFSAFIRHYACHCTFCCLQRRCCCILFLTFSLVVKKKEHFIL